MSQDTSLDMGWSEQATKQQASESRRGRLLRDGNFAMFVHWGLYSCLANRWQDKTYYGIGEWIMHPAMAGISVEQYQSLVTLFNPTLFDARQLVRLAQDAGMKYIVITSKHHEGFAMFHSQASDFNVVDATPLKRDLIKEIADACQEAGMGLGLYYSHFQDWTALGGGGGPTVDATGKPADFDHYFRTKCLPQVDEITRNYGPLEVVWFDTPCEIDRSYVEELVKVVRANQPDAMISGRIGHDLGDYLTAGDMEVPMRNIEGTWEALDTTNDAWGFAHYDTNWKSPLEILKRLITTVARGGTYLLNVGPKSDGTIPAAVEENLRGVGRWIRRYPQVIYETEASPWRHAMPWGDIIAQGSTIYLCVFDWPGDGMLYLPGLRSRIVSAEVFYGDERMATTWGQKNGWKCLNVPDRRPEKLVSVISLTLDGIPDVDPTHGVDPTIDTSLPADFAAVRGCKQSYKQWMEKFGEWRHRSQISQWEPEGTASWAVTVIEPGSYRVDLTYAGTGRLVWRVQVEDGQSIENQQGASHIYGRFPIGQIHFDSPGRRCVYVSLVDGDPQMASLAEIHFSPVLL